MSVLASYLAGKEARRQQDAQDRSDVFRQYLGQNAGAIMSGDQNAMQGAFGIDPMAALQVQGVVDGRRQAQAAERRAATADARAARSEQRAEIRFSKELEQWARNASAEDRRAEAERIRGSIQRALVLPTSEAWDAEMAKEEATQQYVGQYENRERIAETYIPLLDQLERMDGPEPDYLVQDGQFIDQNNPQAGAQPVPGMDVEPEPLSPAGKLKADLDAGRITQEQFDASSRGSSASEQQISRLMEVGIPRDQAILIADGVLKVSRDPVSGEAHMVDARTGQPWTGGQPQGDGEEQPFNPTVPEANYPGAFGGEGLVTNALNAGADALGVELPFPEHQEATTALGNLALRTKTFMQQAFPGRASVQLMQELERVTAKPNSLLTGKQRGRDTLEQTASMIESLITQENRKLRNPRGYTPQMRAEAQANIDALQGLLADYQAVLGGMTNAEPNRTSGGVSWRVVE